MSPDTGEALRIAPRTVNKLCIMRGLGCGGSGTSLNG